MNINVLTNVQIIHTLKTCRQFFPLSFKRLSSISIISIKSPLWNLMRKKDKVLLRKITQLIVSHLSDVVHLCPRGTPWIVRGGSTDLCLSVWVSFGVVFGDTEGSFAKMLHGCVKEIAVTGHSKNPSLAMTPIIYHKKAVPATHWWWSGYHACLPSKRQGFDSPSV